MGRTPCCSKVGLHRGQWTPKEDEVLTRFIRAHGEGHWRSLPKKAGLLRCGKSCRMRWKNYLRPDIKRGNITSDEEDLIMRLHALLGNRWSLIARRLPGRTDNEIKNYWSSRLRKRLRSQESDLNTGKRSSETNKRRRRRSNKKAINKKQNINDKQKILEHGKVEVHKPKPLRWTSSLSLQINDSAESNAIISSTISNTEEVVLETPKDQSEIRSFVEDDNVTNGSDLDVFQSYGPVTYKNYLEKLCEEYFENLENTDYSYEEYELDSFAQSLLL